MTAFLHPFRRKTIAATVCGLALLAGVGSSAETGAPLFQLVKDYPLPGKATRWDYMSLDSASSRLYIAHLGDSTVVAVDTTTKAVVGVIPAVARVHGVLAIPELNRIDATATGTNEVVAIDGTSLKITARIPAGVYPDGLAYAPESRKLYVSDEQGKTETVIDALSNKRIATIPLGGSVGNTQYDARSRHIFVNVQGTSELIEIDPMSDTIAQRIAVPHACGNHGLLIEPDLRLAFIACEDNARLLVMNLRTKTIETMFDVGREPDVLAYAPGTGMLYVASESGTVAQFEASRGGVVKLGEQVVGPDAHTVAVDPSTHELYFPLNSHHCPVLRVMRPMRSTDKPLP